MSDCLFCKIAAGAAKADRVFTSNDIAAFRDIHPRAPTHILVVPRKHIPTVNDLAEEDAALIGRLFLTAKEIARTEGIADAGYRLVLNCNEDAGQTVFHLHLHLLGGRSMKWPPG